MQYSPIMKGPPSALTGLGRRVLDVCKLLLAMPSLSWIYHFKFIKAI